MYKFEIVVIFWGDPHFQTVDGLNYTFNGLGEYVLLKSATTEIDVRTERAWNSTNQPSVTGTVFSAVAGRVWYEESNATVSSSRVHVEMPADRTSGTARARPLRSSAMYGRWSEATVLRRACNCVCVPTPNYAVSYLTSLKSV